MVKAFPGRIPFGWWLVRQSFNCVVVRDHSLTGQRMAPHTPQESPKVKTKCVRIGSYRLYAPMVPLAPHPCVRWWNTEEMPLKLTRLGLHSLRGGSSHQKPSHPVGAGALTRQPLSRKPPTQAAWIPTDVVRYSTPSTTVTQKGPRVVQTQAAGNKRDTLKSFTRGITKQGWDFIRLYRSP